jgi:hypothetical protein
MTSLEKYLTFGFEQTFTISNWWTEEGFTHVSDTPLKRHKMLELAKALADILGGDFKESVDIWDNIQYETFDSDGRASFVVTMDPGSIEVKTPPVTADKAQEMAMPLMLAAEKVELVPYRNWWYGIQGHTEGGCHVNMGGLSAETNPFYHDPSLLIKYCAYIHNRPWLHFPFMGPDVGPGGNAMRLDERDDFEKTKELFASYQKSDAQQTYEHFKQCSLVQKKDSFPCIKKFEGPLYLVEDRAQEAMRSAEDFGLIAKMRLEILKNLQNEEHVEKLERFEEIHTRYLTSYFLWEKFQQWANSIGLNPVYYQRFFDRQFPILSSGNNIPNNFGIKEGRRPRKILNEEIVDGVTRSKTIDTSYKRLELFHIGGEVTFDVKVEGLETVSKVFKHEGHLGFGEQGQAYYCYIDLKYKKENPIMSISMKSDKKLVESAKFNVNDMMWC